MSLSTQIGLILVENKATLATAESCTGGLVGHILTNVSGSSAWYVGGIVSYSNSIKHGFLGVRLDMLQSAGAVSASVAKQMALGARQAFDTNYAISITGIAGPTGGTPEKPVGLTYIGVATPDQVVVRRFVWEGSREANKQSSADTALAMLLELLDTRPTLEEEAMSQSAFVEAGFETGGGIRPLAFAWKGRVLRVTDYGRQWEKDGTRHFLVMTRGDQIWELRFVAAKTHWSIHPRHERRTFA